MFQLAHSQIAQSTPGFNYNYFEGVNTNYTSFNNKFIDVGSFPNTMSSYPSIEETKIEYNVENCGIVTMFCPLEINKC
jgi:hypothetical protein